MNGIVCHRLNNQTVALKEFQLRPQEGTPYTAIREGKSCVRMIFGMHIVLLTVSYDCFQRC